MWLQAAKTHRAEYLNTKEQKIEISNGGGAGNRVRLERIQSRENKLYEQKDHGVPRKKPRPRHRHAGMKDIVPGVAPEALTYNLALPDFNLPGVLRWMGRTGHQLSPGKSGLVEMSDSRRPAKQTHFAKLIEQGRRWRRDPTITNRHAHHGPRGIFACLEQGRIIA